MAWWTDWLNIEGFERHVTFLIGATAGVLQIVYLVRKHRRLNRSR